jgi:transcriptional regulator with XRE-family HTH domain
MPAEEARAEGRSVVSMPNYSQNTNLFARCDLRDFGNVIRRTSSHNAYMDVSEDKNGGPNHLRAWRRFRKMKGADLAKALDITPGMVSELENSRRALSAKWLRRLAPALRTTPGHLLDHDPLKVPTDIAEIWFNATEDQREQIVKLALIVVPTGTNG